MLGTLEWNSRSDHTRAEGARRPFSRRAGKRREAGGSEVGYPDRGDPAPYRGTLGIPTGEFDSRYWQALQRPRIEKWCGSMSNSYSLLAFLDRLWNSSSGASTAKPQLSQTKWQ